MRNTDMRLFSFDLSDDNTMIDQSGRRAIIRALVSAVNADGHMDTVECRRLFEQTDRLKLTPEDKLYMMGEIRNPKPVDQLVLDEIDSALARRIYKSVLAVIDLWRPESGRYLTRLAGQLRLSDAEANAIRELSNRPSPEAA